MSDHVWISRAISDTSNYRALTNDLAENAKDQAIESDRRNEAGEALGAEHFPTRLWPTDEMPDRGQPLGDLFFASSVWVVSGRCAQVLRRFDLGDGHLYPVTLLAKDRSTALEKEFFCLNFGNRTQALLPDKSLNIRKTFNDYYRLRGVHNDDDIKLSASAVSDADIWIDPLLAGSFFLSNRLRDALAQADALRGFGDLKRCMVVVDG